MDEETRTDSIPGLKEMEMKIGRKTPESLLIWMRDAAHRGDWCSERERLEGKVNGSINDSLTEKIRDLKLDMAWLRSADVDILRQLVAVHEGIEAVRWLMEERGGLASHGSSLASSQCSLVAADGPAGLFSMSPCRESTSPASPTSPTSFTSLQDPEDACVEPEQRAQSNVSLHSCYFDGPTSNNSPEEMPSFPRPRWSTAAADGSTVVTGQTLSSPRNAYNTSAVTSRQLKPQQLNGAPSQDLKPKAELIRSALDQSFSKKGSRWAVGREVTETAVSVFSFQQLKGGERSMASEENSKTASETLLGYDAQWHWVESQDDVTFL